MLEDLMGQLEGNQKLLKEKLNAITITESLEGVSITGNANKDIVEIKISDELFQSGDKEMLEDLLIGCFNKFIINASNQEAEEAKNAMNSMLPPGFDQLFS